MTDTTMSDSVRVPRSALAWLFGEEPDEGGRWFEKEKFPEATGAYWWRSVFRNKIKKAAAPTPAADVREAVLENPRCPLCSSEMTCHCKKCGTHTVTEDDLLAQLNGDESALASRPAMDEARLRDLHEIANWLRGQFIAFDHDLPARREWVEKIHRAADALAAMRAATGG